MRHLVDDTRYQVDKKGEARAKVKNRSTFF